MPYEKKSIFLALNSEAGLQHGAGRQGGGGQGPPDGAAASAQGQGRGG